MSETAVHGLTRRTVLEGAAAVAAAGTVALGVAAPSAARTRPAAREHVLDISAEDTGERRWLNLTLDAEGREPAGEPAPLHLRSSERKPAEVTVTSSTGRARVHGTERTAAASSATVTVSADQVTTLWVTPRQAGDPGEPADTLTLTTPRGKVAVDVYVEPAGGQWRKAGKNGRELDLGIVAVHMAHLRKGEGTQVLMWSPPRAEEKDGRPKAKKDEPGQWMWHLHELNDCEARVLDTKNLKTRNRDMDAGKGPKKVNIFCGGAAHVPDGRLLIVGGHIVHPHGEDHQDISNAGSVFLYNPEPAVGGWYKPEKKLGKMEKTRWYPTVTGLPDGRVLISSGSSQVLEGLDNENIDAVGYFSHINNDYEIFDPAQGKHGGLIKVGPVELVDTSKIPDQDVTPAVNRHQLATYPNVFVLPQGENGTWVAMIESNRGWLTRYVGGDKNPLERADAMYTMHTEGSRSYPTYGSAVLLPFTPGDTDLRVLSLGGQDNKSKAHRSLSEKQPATATAEILHIDTTRPLELQQGWEKTANNMHTRRQLCDATLLADGTVLVSGGARRGWGNKNSEFVYEAEIFDPDTQTFLRAARAKTDRRYHATALLQSDGTVLKAGSTGGYDEELIKEGADKGKYKYLHSHTDAERYHPGYLFRGPRPRITRAPHVLRYGTQLTVHASGPSIDDHARLAIIRLGSTTHGNEMDQRYVKLDTTVSAKGEGGIHTLTARAPRNPAAAPPGDYMLVVIDATGVPSVATIVRIRKK